MTPIRVKINLLILFRKIFMNIQQAINTGLHFSNGLKVSYIKRKNWNNAMIKVFYNDIKKSHSFAFGFEDILADDWVALFPGGEKTTCVDGVYYLVKDQPN